MNKDEMYILAEILCGDESNESDEIIIDITNLNNGVVVTDPAHKQYNAYLLEM